MDSRLVGAQMVHQAGNVDSRKHASQCRQPGPDGGVVQFIDNHQIRSNARKARDGRHVIITPVCRGNTSTSLNCPEHVTSESALLSIGKRRRLRDDCHAMPRLAKFPHQMLVIEIPPGGLIKITENNKSHTHRGWSVQDTGAVNVAFA